MIPLIQLNMLPYREEQDKQKKAQFTRLMVFSGLVGVGLLVQLRSEERRVGKECRSRWSPYH